MSTVDQTPVLKGRRRAVRLAGIGALGIATTLALSACKPGYDFYVDGYWNNGDGVIAPAKSELFAADGTPTCAFPVKYNLFETRSTSTNLARGVLFEINNTEPDPDEVLNVVDFPTEEDRATEKLRREHMQNSLDTLFQFTHPAFDAENGIAEPGDLAAFKAKWTSILYSVARKAPATDYMKVVETYVENEDGIYIIKRLSNPKDYITSHAIPIEFLGLRETYFSATIEGDEFLMVRDNETGATVLWKGDQSAPLEGYISYARIDVTLNPVTPPYVAELLIQSDGCPEVKGKVYERYYLRDIYEVAPDASDDVTTDPATEPSPSPTS